MVTLLSSPLLSQQPSSKAPFGVAWRVIGSWSSAGSKNLISDGDAILPGSLLKPVSGSADHSITVLLPDGQRILCECFTSRDCERGFRVPQLYRAPTSTAGDLLARVSAVSHYEKSHNKPDEATASRDEAVSYINADGMIEVAGLASGLSDGTYSYVARSLHGPKDDTAREKQAEGTFAKHGKLIRLSVPNEGLFDVRIIDSMKTLRIDLLVAAIHQPGAENISKSFNEVAALLADWNEDYQGWPVHEFRRSYLRSTMLGIAPEVLRASSFSAETPLKGVTCEPQFTPKPGVFKTDTEVALQCNTLGATIHFTVDGSQPLDGATTYKAPIVVKGTALMIRAFASAAGKKDSPVVTGIFRIGD